MLTKRPADISSYGVRKEKASSIHDVNPIYNIQRSTCSLVSPEQAKLQKPVQAFSRERTSFSGIKGLVPLKKLEYGILLDTRGQSAQKEKSVLKP